MGKPQRERNGVVDVGELGGMIAAGKPTRHIPAPDEPLQLGRRAITELGWGIAGMAHRPDLGPLADQLGHH